MGADQKGGPYCSDDLGFRSGAEQAQGEVNCWLSWPLHPHSLTICSAPPREAQCGAGRATCHAPGDPWREAVPVLCQGGGRDQAAVGGETCPDNSHSCSSSWLVDQLRPGPPLPHGELGLGGPWGVWTIPLLQAVSAWPPRALGAACASQQHGCWFLRGIIPEPQALMKRLLASHC